MCASSVWQVVDRTLDEDVLYINHGTDHRPPSAMAQITDHVTGIGIIKNVVAAVRKACQDPLQLLSRDEDFFGGKMQEDVIWRSVQDLCPRDTETHDMLMVCISAIMDVINRQYEPYFNLDVTEQLRIETKSVRPHNIDAEEMVGMFSAAKQRAPNSTLCYISSKLRAKKNHTVEFIDAMDAEEREKVVKWSVAMGRKKRQANRRRHDDMQQELSRRAAFKRQKKDEKQRKMIEKTIRNMKIEDIANTFPDLDKKVIADLHDILSGVAIGRNICHLWYDLDSQNHTICYGRLEKVNT